LLVVQDGEALVGYAVVRVGEGAATWDIGERVGELESLSVAAAVRGGGVGAALVAAARDFAHSRGAERLIVSVVHNNTAALRFYEREGFGPFYVLLAER
jgi:ribosomal protein S18 acetylase RimI-like enzyme